ncbi:phosphonate C-P lyase system protein PhnH [Rhizobium sp.]
MNIQACPTGLMDPIHQSQAVFRTLLQAMARPGVPRAVTTEVNPPPSFNIATASLALSLFDSDVKLFLGESFRTAAARSYLHLHCGVRIVEQAVDADFAIEDGSRVPFEGYRPVDPRTPHLGTTVILQVKSLDGGEPVVLRGPGIEDRVTLRAEGLPAGFWDEWDRNAAGYPRGIDVILTTDRLICGLPRTTRRA